MRHCDEGDGKPVQIISAAAQRDAIGKFSRDDRLASARDRIDTPHELHAEENPSQPGENYGYPFDPRKRLEDPHASGHDLTRVTADEQRDPVRNVYAAPEHVRHGVA